jgi:hypothetical protein
MARNSPVVKSTSSPAGYSRSLAEKSLLYFRPILSDRLNNAIEESLQHVRPHSSLDYKPPVPVTVVIQPSQIQQVSLTL